MTLSQFLDYLKAADATADLAAELTGVVELRRRRQAAARDALARTAS